MAGENQLNKTKILRILSDRGVCNLSVKFWYILPIDTLYLNDARFLSSGKGASIIPKVSRSVGQSVSLSVEFFFQHLRNSQRG